MSTHGYPKLEGSGKTLRSKGFVVNVVRILPVNHCSHSHIFFFIFFFTSLQFRIHTFRHNYCECLLTLESHLGTSLSLSIR